MTAMRTRFRFIAALLLLAGCSVEAEAGTRLVHAVGRAAIAGKDIAAARKSALAEALYDAAGQVRMVVRGTSFLSDAGTIHEESGVAVSGLLKGYEVVDEHREGDHYVVAIDAIAETDDGECASSKKADIALGGIGVRVAPGLDGSVERRAKESIEGFIAELEGYDTLHVIDDRRFHTVAETSATVGQNTTYLEALAGHSKSPAAYTISGTLMIERTRRDTVLVGEAIVDITADLQLIDNVSGAVKETFTEHATMPLEKHMWGTGIALPQKSEGDIDALWQSVAQRIADSIGCDSLRAVILSVSGNRATLSAGSSNGVKAGDFFLVEMPSRDKNAWQLIRVESAGASQSVARLLKPSPAVHANAVAVLLQ
jgi:hypothetical protein